MPDLIDHLAELTGQRDRDVLDVTLVGALRELLGGSTVSVSMYRCVGDPGNERWLTRARLVGAEAVAQADPAWSDLEELPPVVAVPARLSVLIDARTLAEASAGGNWLTRFPVVTDREVIGVLEVETASALDTRQQRTVASILRMFRNFQALLDSSERDTLTGLLNRKTFDESFLKATAVPAPTIQSDDRRSSGAAGTYWIGVIDIDRFKSVNDNYGHLIGDEVLLLLSRLMRSTLRSWDRLYRFGGEEFVALIRCQDRDSAMIAFERLRTNAANYAFPQVGRITVSIGFTDVRAGDTPSGAFERADKAVYYAKQHGRDQVRHYDALVAGGEIADEPIVSDVELF